MPFQKIIQETLALFADFPCENRVLPESFSRIERNEIEGILVMETQFLALADRGELRIVHIHAPKINVLTLFFFPNAQWQLPVYCLELVIFGTQPIVGLLDSICLLPMACTNTVHNFMLQAHKKYPNLQQCSEVPTWFERCRSGFDFFLRPQTNEELLTLAQIHLSVLANSIKVLLQSPHTFNQDEIQEHQRLLQGYKHHHQINAPGLRLMNRSFGEIWTNDYMNLLFQ